MTIAGFGRATPVHCAMLMLIGWELTRGEFSFIPDDPDARVALMRVGHAQLVRWTGVDFGFDLVQWRDLLLCFGDEFGYVHPYAFERVDRAVRDAIADPEFARFRRLAEADPTSDAE